MVGCLRRGCAVVGIVGGGVTFGGIYGVSRGTFFQGIEIVALTAVRATI